MSYREQVREARRKIIETALEAAQGNCSQAARNLQVRRPDLYKLLKEFGIERRYPAKHGRRVQ